MAQTIQAPTAFQKTQDAINAYRASGTRCYCTTGQIDWETGEDSSYFCKNCEAHEAFGSLENFRDAIDQEWVFADDMSEPIESDWRTWLRDDHYPLHEDDDHEELFSKFCAEWHSFYSQAVKREVAA